MRYSAWFMVLAAACGGSHPEPSHGGPGEHHERGMSPPIKEFHDVLAPVWHSEPGATRTAKACESSNAMVDKVAATNDPDLITAVSAMAKTCMSSDRAKVEEQLTEIHTRFHALMER